MEEIQVFISLATSVIAFITLIYNLGIKKGNARERRYYEKILRPYVEKLSENEQISAVETIKGLVAGRDEDIPKYIYYLITKEDNAETDEKLMKVLLYDYVDIYPNDYSNIAKILNSISKILYYIIFFIALIILFLGFLSVSGGLTDIIFAGYDFIINGGQLLDIIDIISNQCGYLFGVGVVMFGISVLLMKLADCADLDRYSLSKNKIEFMINKKVNKYNKKGKEYVL